MVGYLANPLFLFVAVWGVAGASYLAGVCTGLFPAPRPLTVVLLLVNAVTFPLGYLTWTLFQGLEVRDSGLARSRRQPLTSTRLQWALAFTLLMGVLALGLILCRVAAIAAYFGVSVVDLLMRPVLLRFGLFVFLERAVSQTNLLVKFISLTSALFTIGFVLLGIFLRLDTTARRYVYLAGFLLVGLVTCLVNLSRYDMTVYALYLVLSYCAVSSPACRERSPHAARSLVLPVLAVVAMFVIVELLLRKGDVFDPTERFHGVLYSLYWSLASPIAAFNEFLGGFQGPYDLGLNTFYPIFKWLHQLGLIPPPDLLVYGEFIFIPHPANVYTYLRNFYEDFGLLGVALVPYVLGALVAAIRGRAGRDLPFLILHVFLLIPIIFSFYSYPLLPTQFYLQIAFAFLLFRYRLPEEQGEWNDGTMERWNTVGA
jgi:oligosaccharide repeat unit polymerase